MSVRTGLLDIFAGKHLLMKILWTALTVVLLFTGCSPRSGVEYVKVADIDMGNLKKESARLNAILVFNNLSADAFVMKDLVLDLKIDGKDIGTILVKKPKEIRPHSEFTVGTDYMYETSRIVEAGEEPADVYLVELEGDLTLKDNNGEEVMVPVKYKSSYVYQTAREERKQDRKERKEERKKEKAMNN